jgi:hypothetical protein
VLTDLREIARLPRVTINLMFSATRDNDPFFARQVREFYALTRKRHRRFPLIRLWRYGVALCRLPADFDAYFMAVEAAARRNYKKAARMGYRFERIRHDDHLKGIQAIHRSTDVRQGLMSEEWLQREVTPCGDPQSRSNIHDYPYFGILKGNELVAYAGNLVSGEAFMIEQIYGHAAYQADGVVPMLLIGMAQYTLQHYPCVKYYVNEMYYGAGETLRRFKRKFGFYPHKVTWVLG